jgi:hypothetical protein
MGKKVGEAKVAIYPRTTHPKPNHRASPGEDIYRFSDVVSLLRTAQVKRWPRLSQHFCCLLNAVLIKTLSCGLTRHSDKLCFCCCCCLLNIHRFVFHLEDLVSSIIVVKSKTVVLHVAGG